eukprot:CAMPEP_0119291440 /NCGR_PEP_ID=MMETSP1329-20130426/42463_1 /TAXON_ID=114041 /ORGANISM="Genus nov. species nov., Strain RCC1024" /LENGTH=329 /DNA_ID=CAMNT_0007292269 /DNA_START=78 /DNA_END=1064 /DNA_ORIENTATION=+
MASKMLPIVGRNIRWGIMGTGTIAHDFVKVLQSLPGCEVAAVGSRSAEGADRFGGQFDIPGRHDSYEALARDESLDVVYVATPSMRHVDDSLLCLGAGRHVVCEKAMAPSVTEAKRVVDAAVANDRFFLHAVWSRFFPAMAELRQTIASGAIGDVVAAHASFGQNDGAGHASATLETGIYCAQFLQWAFDGEAPEAVEGVTYSLEEKSGLDQHVGALLRFPGGRVGTFECSLRHPTPRAATICGTEGVITVPFPFWCPTSFSVQTMTGLGSQTWSAPAERTFALPSVEGPFNFVNSEGLAYEAAEVNACLRAGRSESEFFDHRENLAVM